MNIVFISHNIPFPPNKGEKIRAFNILKHLTKDHQVFLFSLSREKINPEYIKELSSICKSVKTYELNPWISRLNALFYIPRGLPLTFGYFFSKNLKKDLARCLKENKIDLIFSYCSSAAQYVHNLKGLKKIIDFVDIDSDKWGEYSKLSSFPKSQIFALEHKRLGEWEKSLAIDSDISLVTTLREKKKLNELCPGSDKKTFIVENGVDIDLFTPKEKSIDDSTLIYTGQMDYLPNVDAVVNFYSNIFPLIKKKVPHTKFMIVGRNPDPSIKTICEDAIITGEVRDIREYLHKGTIFVAPIRLSFGLANKILEAMASGIPVVASKEAIGGMDAKDGVDILVAENEQEFADKVVKLLLDRKLRMSIAKAGREYVIRRHDWSGILENLRID